MLNKKFLEDARMSWKAKGLVGYLLSRSDEWEIRMEDLIKRSTDGRDTVYSALPKLKDLGSVKEANCGHARGYIRAREYLVFETPSLNTKTRPNVGGT